jgi:predicted transcriptional regulator
MDEPKPKGGRPAKPYTKRRQPVKNPKKRRPQSPISHTSIVPASAYIRSIPEAVTSLLELADKTEEHWRKMDAVAMHFAELALSLSSQIDKPGEALFCAEKALALREKYEEMKERVEQTASNIGIVVEYSDMLDVCKSPQLTMLNGKSTASA